MKKEVENVKGKAKVAIEQKNKLLESLKEEQLKQIVPDKFVNKIKVRRCGVSRNKTLINNCLQELNNLVKDHMRDNRQLCDTVEQLTEERRMMQSRIERLENSNTMKPKYDDSVARVSGLKKIAFRNSKVFLL